jgi:hypothetical protein
MAQQSARRDRENQCFPQCFEHALGEMDQARELPYRPAAAQRRTRGRTDGGIRLRVTAILQFSLAKKGASTDGKRSLASTHRGGGVAPLAAIPIEAT